MKTINQVLRNYPKEATSEICNEHYSHEGSVETTIPLDKKMCITSRCAQ